MCACLGSLSVQTNFCYSCLLIWLTKAQVYAQKKSVADSMKITGVLGAIPVPFASLLILLHHSKN